MTPPINSKIPKIRFKGFTGEWEKKTLGDFGRVAMNKRIFKHQTSETGEIPFFKIGTFGKEPDSFISRQLFTEYKRKFSYPNEGDLLISAAGSIGRIVEYCGKDEYFQDSNIVWLQHDGAVVNAFLKQFYSVVKWAGLEGSTIKRLYNKNILETQIVLPKKDEQTKIGGYFRELDRLIGLQQRKHDKLVTLKKAMLRKMFPQPGTTTPEIRFKGFEREWKRRTIDQLAIRYDNLRIPISASKRMPGKTPYYGANGIQGYVQGHTHDGEFILVAEDGANDLNSYPVQFVSGKVWVNNHAHVLQGKDGLAETRFLKYAFTQINVGISIVGGGRAKLNAETMMQIELRAPEDIEEQQKISTYFYMLDELIAKHAVQLQKLKQLKSACLERMFV